MEKSSVVRLVYCMKCLPFRLSMDNEGSKDSDAIQKAQKTKREPGGWKAMPYVIGTETFERLGTIGLTANIMVYLLTQYHLDQVSATNIMNIWSGTTNFVPLLGAFVSDSYWGRFKTLAYASIATLLGLVTLTQTALIPELKPAKCNPLLLKCVGPTKAQLGFLYLGMGLLTIGAAGIRPCNLPFGADQFDPTTEKGRRGIDSFFNWYYMTFNLAMVISLTVIVYIQTNISWAWGFIIPTVMMLFSIILFFIGTKIYVHVPPEGSVLSGMAQVMVAAFKKRGLVLPATDQQAHLLYDPPLKASAISKLSITHHFSFLNKAGIILDGELKQDGSPLNPWRLCSIQRIEELKCLIRIIPIWASGIICLTSMSQQWTFTISQGLKMDRHLGPHFQIPTGSLPVINLLALSIFIPIYDRLLVPTIRRFTKHPGGITLLQRMGIGMVFSILSMVVAGLVEEKRRRSALSHGSSIAPITALWLAPQLALMGIAEAFNLIAQIEFYYKQFPEDMRSFAAALLSCTLAGASYLSTLLVTIVHKYTGKNGRHNWLDNDLNVGKLDYFYYIIAGLGVLNLVYFLVCAQFYRYKGSMQEEETKELDVIVEINGSKSVEK